MRIPFSKFQGIGNDFIIINNLERKISLSLKKIKQLCDRHFGIGADGIVIILPSKKANLKVKFFNPDGSEAEICGNGIRCAAKFAFEKGLCRKKKIAMETKAGLKLLELSTRENKVQSVQVDMGEPIFTPEKIPIRIESEEIMNETLEVGKKKIKFSALSMGNPHCCIFVKDLAEAKVREWGPIIENHPLFPERTNVEFIQVIKLDQISVRVWERGAGETLACGTGACASLAASVKNNLSRRKTKVHLPGGDLEIDWAKNNHLYLSGPAEEVFSGYFDL